jgi:hypothetical protein
MIQPLLPYLLASSVELVSTVNYNNRLNGLQNL